MQTFQTRIDIYNRDSNSCSIKSVFSQTVLKDKGRCLRKDLKKYWNRTEA